MGHGAQHSVRRGQARRRTLPPDRRRRNVDVDFTIEDPEYLKEPYSGADLWRYAPPLKLVPNKCDVDVARRYLGGE